MKLSAAFFTGNRAKLREAIPDDAPIVIAAAGLLQRSADTTFPFRQDSNFWYLTGINEPDIALVIDKAEEYLILPPRNDIQILFDGAVEREQLSRSSGVSTIYDEVEGWQKLTKSIKSAGRVATVDAPPAYVDAYGFYTNPARATVMNRIRSNTKINTIVDIRPELSKLRCIKQAVEVTAIRHAVDVTCDALESLEQQLSSIQTEYEAAALITHEFHKRQLEHGYEPIVASGKNACTVHYIRNNSPLDKSAYLLLDVGAQVDYYSADITRVLHPSKPTARQLAVASAVADVQAYAMSLLKPGVVMTEYETLVEQYMGKQLQRLKLIKTTDRDSVRRYFPYLTSHFLGLDVHDVGDRSAPLQPGMVMTVEPGIHIPAESIAVRIEDDVLITKTGVEVLGRKR